MTTIRSAVALAIGRRGPRSCAQQDIRTIHVGAWIALTWAVIFAALTIVASVGCVRPRPAEPTAISRVAADAVAAVRIVRLAGTQIIALADSGAIGTDDAARALRSFVPIYDAAIALADAIEVLQRLDPAARAGALDVARAAADALHAALDQIALPVHAAAVRATLVSALATTARIAAALKGL